MNGTSDSPFHSPSTDPDLYNRLKGGLVSFLEETYPRWGRSQAEALLTDVDKGRLFPALWKPTDGSSRGLCLTGGKEGDEGVWGLYLDPSGPAHIRSFLVDLEARDGEGVRSVIDVLPGLGLDEQPALFEPFGYWHFAKVLMRREPTPGLPFFPNRPEIRPARPEDFQAIVRLFGLAYGSERPGEWWVEYSVYSEENARAYLRQFINEDGTWATSSVPEACYVWESAGEVIGAVIVDNTNNIRTIADLMVAPKYHRQSVGRMLMEAALSTLTERFPGPVELVAIRGGAPQRLYRRLGFKEVPLPEGRRDGRWIKGPPPPGMDGLGGPPGGLM